MTEQTIPPCEGDEISLLDILVTLAESWKLLVFGPLIAGVLAGGLSFLLPNTFESVAIVRLNDEEVALLHTAPVLDSLIVQFALADRAEGKGDDARQGLKNRLTVAVDKKTKLAAITATAAEAGQAQALGGAAVEALLNELKVKGKAKTKIENTIAINNSAIDVSEDAIESIQRAIRRGNLNDQALESALKNLAAINSDVVNRKQDNEILLQKLEMPGTEVVVQAPSLPARKVSPKRSLLVLLTVLSSGFVLLMFVFIRKAWQTAALDTQNMGKIERIKQLIRF